MCTAMHTVGAPQMFTDKARGPLSANVRFLCGCRMFQTWAQPPPSQACTGAG